MRLTISQALLAVFLFAVATVAKAEWKPVVDLEDLFPSYIISTASMQLPSTGATPDDYIGKSHVMQQVFAVWNVLQRHNIQYSSITRPSAYSKNVLSQHVRSFEDAFTNKQANCVDGSVLLASIFRKVGLDTFIVLKPGHCYMGVYSKKDKSVVLILETTVLGSVDVNEPSLERGWNSFMSGRDNNLSRTSFERAMDAGWRQYQEDRTKFNQEFGYRLIEIDPARRIGITPIRSKF